ncbi:MAG TPA: alginate lyase family protein [Vicinamibacterales bacterium]|nr:alginate lyase family protein [Vicinamibacterales bacterium]
MNGRQLARRMAAMGPAELRFRAAAHTRVAAQRAAQRLRPSRWHRGDLAQVLAAAPSTDDAREAAREGAFPLAQERLAAHFASRRSCWPRTARDRAVFTQRLQALVPAAAAEASARADRLVAGRCDLLGYRDLACGTPPDWHRDPVHDRRAPLRFWADVPYLDPAMGDHKIIWELNRQQHWLALGRAWWLTGDRRCPQTVERELVSWMQANPPLHGINWASMLELALRAISWTWAIEFFAEGAAHAEEPWLVDLLVGLDRQLGHVARNLSRYFSPNTHLTGEALALYGVGRALPELARAAEFAELGRAVLREQARRQIRGDGGHAERSAHYHRYSTDFYLLALLVARASGDEAAADFEDALRRQARYLRVMADDRGLLPLIGDDDGGQLLPMCGRTPADASPTLAAAAALLGEPALAVGPAPEEALWLLPQTAVSGAAPHGGPPPASTLLPDSGYFVGRSAAGDHLVFDAGPHGFLNGGHAHSSALALTLTVGGRPVLVDPGTATYTMDEATRDRFRSTRMHNTVTIDGRNHVEPRGPFGWEGSPAARLTLGRRAEGFDVAEGTRCDASGVTHVRTIVALHGVGWLVLDHLFGGDRSLTADAWWHLHPSWTPAVRAGRIELRHTDGTILAMAGSTELRVLAPGHSSGLASYAPEYGRMEPAYVLQATATARPPACAATFLPARHARGARLDVDMRPIEATPGDGWGAAAVHVETPDIDLLVLAAVPRGVPAQPSPAHAWGAAGVRTDGRVACVCVERTRGVTLSLVNGSALALPEGAPGLDLPAGTSSYHGVHDGAPERQRAAGGR